MSDYDWKGRCEYCERHGHPRSKCEDAPENVMAWHRANALRLKQEKIAALRKRLQELEVEQ